MSNLSHDQMQSFVSDLYAAIKAREDAHKKTQMFGAIRRAAKVAREIEVFYVEDGRKFIGDVDSYEQAEAIRRAIRAAIGSERA